MWMIAIKVLRDHNMWMVMTTCLSPARGYHWELIIPGKGPLENNPVNLASNNKPKMPGLFVRRNHSGSGTSAPALPLRLRPPGINRLDHQIQLQNGTTSILGLSRHSLRQAKHNSERTNELITQLQHDLQDSVRREVDAEKCWMEFWGIQTEKGKKAGQLWI